MSNGIGSSTCPFENEQYETIIFSGPSTEFRLADEWCKENCKGKWYSGLPNPFYWKFTDKEDAMAFKLMFG